MSRNNNNNQPTGSFNANQIQNIFNQAMGQTWNNGLGAGAGFGSSVHEDARRQGFQIGESQDPVSRVGGRGGQANNNQGRTALPVTGGGTGRNTGGVPGNFGNVLPAWPGIPLGQPTSFEPVRPPYTRFPQGPGNGFGGNQPPAPVAPFGRGNGFGNMGQPPNQGVPQSGGRLVGWQYPNNPNIQPVWFSSGASATPLVISNGLPPGNPAPAPWPPAGKDLYFCSWASAIYSSKPVQWQNVNPCHIIRLPTRPDARFQLTLEVRANMCTPTWGQPMLQELWGCPAHSQIFQTKADNLFCQIHVAVVLADRPNRAVSPESDTTVSDPPTPAPGPQGQFLQTLSAKDERPSRVTIKAATDNEPTYMYLGQMVEHRHSDGRATYPSVLAPETGWMGTEQSLANAAAHLLAGTNQIYANAQGGGGFVWVLKQEVRKCLRWSMAARPDSRPDEDVVLDEGAFAAVEGEYIAAVREFEDRHFLEALVQGMRTLRDMTLMYQRDMNPQNNVRLRG
ncbi:hypothetical protein PG993_012473 [Apiospora rasikravindrae]|uniref:Uncharacterized protein n=1 Tax=Apiospora rasikravindrae TaxID=990691 RepID=A0ABR1S2K6_9PEZI